MLQSALKKQTTERDYDIAKLPVLFRKLCTFLTYFFNLKKEDAFSPLAEKVFLFEIAKRFFLCYTELTEKESEGDAKMNKSEKRKLIIGVISLFLIVLAIILRNTSFEKYPRLPGLARSFIYIFLMSAWGISIRRRIIQPQVRRYLSAIAALIVFWVLIRTLKYFLPAPPVIERYLWYLFYLPLLFIPVFSVFVAFSLGKGEDFRLPKKAKFLYLPAATLLLLVLSNDFHNFVFSFPLGTDNFEENYLYSPGSYIVFGFEIFCAIIALVMMILKCRIPKSRKFHLLPTIPLFLAVLYTLLYALKVRWLYVAAGDITISVSILIILTFECCISCGLIQSNADYELLFSSAKIKAQITDDNLNVLLSSAGSDELSRKELEGGVSGAFRLDRNTVLKSHRLQKGYVFWQEDISELANTIEQLELTQEELRDTGDVLKAESEQKSHWLKLSEENRLYDLVEKKTFSQVALIRSMISQIKKTDNLDEAKRLLGKVVAVGTYIKRKSNLIFVESKKKTIAAGELRLCLNESAVNLRLCGAECKAVLDFEGQLSADCANTVYDLFEAVIEKSFDSLSMLLLFSECRDEKIIVNISVCCEDELFSLKKSFPSLDVQKDDDGLFCLRLELERFGEKL